MQVVLRCGQPFGSAQSRPKPGGTRDTTGYAGPKTSGTDLTFQNRSKESIRIRRKRRRKLDHGPRPRGGIGQEAKGKKRQDQKEKRMELIICFLSFPSRKLRGCVHAFSVPGIPCMPERSTRQRSGKKKKVITARLRRMRKAKSGQQACRGIALDHRWSVATVCTRQRGSRRSVAPDPKLHIWQEETS
jgi:hypothetical protein